MSNSSVLTASTPTARRRPLRNVLLTGVVATLAAMAIDTVVAALAHAVGVDFQIPDGGEAIPLPGIAVMTGFFSAVGIVIAVSLRRWSTRPATRFGWTAAALTVISLGPPLLSGASAATVVTLLGLHLLPAGIVIPALMRGLRID